MNKLVAFIGTIAAVCASSFMMVSAAEEGAKQTGWAGWIGIIIYVLFFIAIGYFLIFRPNKKRKEQEEKLRSSLMLGDQIVTIGGICGTIVNIKDDTITIETSLDRTLIEFKNWAIREVKKLETDDAPAK
ncbi:MAG: preprotein translocase subunit YajC [Clostridia bacterium]|nr:preprotein translocase subunit YajC [Clostridia bacterium]